VALRHRLSPGLPLSRALQEGRAINACYETLQRLLNSMTYPTQQHDLPYNDLVQQHGTLWDPAFATVPLTSVSPIVWELR